MMVNILGLIKTAIVCISFQIFINQIYLYLSLYILQCKLKLNFIYDQRNDEGMRDAEKVRYVVVVNKASM